MGESMKRTHYRNGDKITLACGCDSCNPAMVNGVLCHEQGCQDAWRDYLAECRECGMEFYPEERGDRLCSGCTAIPEYDWEMEGE